MTQFVQKYLTDLKKKEISILDIGSQDVNGTYKPLFAQPGWNYFGLDIVEGENVNIVVKDIYRWKEIKDHSFDVVISGQALEHVEFFWLTMLEISRVLKNDGLLCLIVPSSGYEHRYPKDCYRFFPDGLKALADYSFLETIEAYNCWDNYIIDGEPNDWKDSVLIARKVKQSMKRRFHFFLRNYINKIL
ncbi:MAG: class I SAM-dependent methyltransferase [Bacteroidota bacterium]